VRARPAASLALASRGKIDGQITGIGDQRGNHPLGVGVVAADPLDDTVLLATSDLGLKARGERVETLGVKSSRHPSRVVLGRGLPIAWRTDAAELVAGVDDDLALERAGLSESVVRTERTTSAPNSAASRGVPILPGRQLDQ
jgi:hypothetical protein